MRGCTYSRQCIQLHSPISYSPCLLNDLFGQRPSNALPAKDRTHKQPLHLANNIIVQRPQSRAPRRLTINQCQQQSPARRRINSRQSLQLGREPLKAKIYLKPSRILFKQTTYLDNFFRNSRLKYLHGVYAIKSRTVRQEYNMIVESILHDRKEINPP